MRKAVAVVWSLAVSAPSLAAKPPFCGFVTMGRPEIVSSGTGPDIALREANAHAGVYSGAVLLVGWNALEPARGRFDFAAIDAGLRNVAAYNHAHPDRPIRAKLRVFMGPAAPAWAQSIGGPPVVFTTRKGSRNVTGRFWLPEYRAAWRELQTALAARYDRDPLMGEVAISSCSSKSAEPFILGVSSEGSAALHAAGYTDAAYRACLSGTVDDYAAWHETPLDLTFNTFHAIDGARPVPDIPFTQRVMQDFRARLGARAVLANHGLRPDMGRMGWAELDEIRRLGPPIEFQTLIPRVDMPATVQMAFGLGATEIELWDSRAAGGGADLDQAELAGWTARFTCRIR